LSEENRSWAVFKAVIALDEMVHPISDRSEPNDSFSINEVDLARDFGIEKVF
jgi:hypothetical protein